jgi:5-methylcytosine-specific restriction protein A
MTLKCSYCGREFQASPADFSTRKYCSRACASAHYNSSYLTGQRNGNWRGGRVLSYGANWKRTKQEVRNRDRVCRTCGKTPQQNGRALDVHHVNPFRFSGDNSPENLMALCRSCHMRADDHGRKGSAKFAGPIQLTLKPPSQRELRQRRGREQRQRRRELKEEALRLTAQGKSLRQVARGLGVSHQTVSNWITGRYVSEDAVPYFVSEEAPPYLAA